MLDANLNPIAFSTILKTPQFIWWKRASEILHNLGLSEVGSMHLEGLEEGATGLSTRHAELFATSG